MPYLYNKKIRRYHYLLSTTTRALGVTLYHINALIKNRLLLVLLILLIECIAISFAFDAQILAKPASHSSILKLLSHAGQFLRISLIAISVYLLIASKKLSQSLALFNAEAKPKHVNLRFVLHFALFAGFWLLSSLLFNATTTPNPNITNTLGWLWLLIGSLSIISLLLAQITYCAWRQFLSAEKLNLVIALLAGFITWGLSTLASTSWSKLADITFYASHTLLSLFYNNVTALPKEKALGIGDFQVEIGIPCSGYEGIGLIIIFLSIYLWLMRAELRFPQVLLLYPIGVTLMWFFNVLRISLLIIVGKEWSPEIAIGGFHSNAGWIAFIALSVGMIGIAQRVAFFKPPLSTPISSDSYKNPAMPLLLPFIALMATILITGAFSSGFDWLYPLRVIVSMGVLAYFANAYRPWLQPISLKAVLIGSGVFILWLAAVPASVEQDQAFAKNLATAPLYWQYLWLGFRIIGATITVPIIEELAFRGYLLAKLVNKDFEQATPGQFTPLSFIVSSVLFGILHGAWLAGTLAGMAYALAYYQRKTLTDAITAHAVTNALLAVYVMMTGHWSLW